MAQSKVLSEVAARREDEKPRSPVEGFRYRVARLIDTRFDGKYTLLAARARIPTSTMEHYIHRAKHLPGGEHIERIADALGVTTDHLIKGTNNVRPTDLLAQPVLLHQEGFESAPKLERLIAVPTFTCTCPEKCAFAQDPPPVHGTLSRALIPAELVPHWSRLIALRIAESLAHYGWKVGTRIIVDWDARNLDSPADKFLFQLDDRCRLGRLHPDKDILVVMPPNTPAGADSVPSFVERKRVTVLGKVVALITAV